MPTKYLQIDGVATYVHHTGASTLPEAPPRFEHARALLCLHGEGGNGHVFHRVLDALATDHDLVAFDQPGHGRSGGLDSLGSIPAMASFVETLGQKLGIEAPVLLGHGMGSAVAIQRAADAPASVSALILCAAGQTFAPAEAALDLARRISEGKARRAFDPGLFSPKTAPEIMREAFMEGIKTDPRATYGDLTALRDWSPSAIDRVRVPTLVVHGADDVEAVRSGAAGLCERIEGARKVVIPGAGHSLPLEAPDALAETVRGFLGDLS